jgi:hypothetical protein
VAYESLRKLIYDRTKDLEDDDDFSFNLDIPEITYLEPIGDKTMNDVNSNRETDNTIILIEVRKLLFN